MNVNSKRPGGNVFRTHKRLKVVIAGLTATALAMAGVAVSTTTASAAPIVPLPLTAVSQQAGTVTSADFDALGGTSVFPYSNGSTVLIHLNGVFNNATPTPVAIADAAPLIAAF